MSDGAEASRILIVEDDLHLARGMAENLCAEGHTAEVILNGEQGLAAAVNNDYDLLVLDVMLPVLDGFSLCQALRQQGKNTPVLFLTARGDPDDRIRGLKSGGDDYMAKPFHLSEFLLRVQAILRRWRWYKSSLARSSPDAVLRFAGNEVDFRTFRARSWDGGSHELTEKEVMILKLLADAPGQVISRDDLLEKAWGFEIYPSTRTIDNFILRLRKRFERDPHTPCHFLTVRGVGYCFMPEGESAAR